MGPAGMLKKWTIVRDRQCVVKQDSCRMNVILAVVSYKYLTLHIWISLPVNFSPIRWLFVESVLAITLASR